MGFAAFERVLYIGWVDGRFWVDGLLCWKALYIVLYG